MLRPRSLDKFLRWLVLLSGLPGVFGPVAFAADVVLRLSSGDQVSGTVIYENTNRVVLSNSWISEISIPQNQIIFRTTNAPPAMTAVESVPPSPPKPAPTEPKKPAVVVQPSPWKGEVQVGLNLLYGARDQEVLYGRLKLAYVKPYLRNPSKAFRNTLDYTIDYGRTDGVKSSDRMNVSDKTAFDFTDNWYVYNLVGGGYDHILKINAQYDAGPGAGYHLFTRTNFVMNVEAGLNYQEQFRSDDSTVEHFYYRLAEDFVWKFGKRLSLAEKLEVSPQSDFSEFRGRFESTLSYELWKNLALNLTVMDSYDSQPADKVTHNELQIRSALGVKF